MEADESARLVAMALGGDPAAQGRLVAMLTPVIHARVSHTLLARRWALAGRDIHAEVEDLVQDVFLHLFDRDGRVLRSWQPGPGRLSLNNFVGLVAKCQTLSFLRSGRRNAWKEELATGEEIERVAEEPDAEEIVASREELRLLLDRMCERLSSLGWHLFVLLFVQELSVEEVTAETGLSAAAVYAWRSRLRRLARELRSELSKSGSSPRRPGEEDENDDEDDEHAEDDKE